MHKFKFKQLLSVVLAMMLAVSSVASSVTPVLASGLITVDQLIPTGQTGGGASKDDGTAANLAKTIYFGKKGSDGLLWRVLSTGDKVLLLSDKVLTTSKFDASVDKSNVWSSSTVRGLLTDIYDRADTADPSSGITFDGREKAQIAKTTISEDIAGDSTQDHLFLLSEGDVKNSAYGFTGNTSRKATGDDSFWWLRSPSGDGFAFYVHPDGYVLSNDVDYSLGVRAALNLNPSKVVFLSAATGGKKDVGVASGFKLDNTYTGANGWKVTLKSADIKKPKLGAFTLDKTGDSTIAYSGASTGTNKYVSAVLKDNSNNFINYAKLVDTSSDASGTMTIKAGNATSGSMLIFGEEANEDYLTDYASEFNEPIPVTFTSGKLTGMTLGSAFTDASNAVTLKNGFELTLANATYNQDFTSDTGSNTLIADANGTTLAGNVNVANGATLTTVNEFTLKGTNTIDGTLAGAPITIAGQTTVGASGTVSNSGLNFNLDGHKPNDVFIRVNSANPINLSGKTIGLVQTDSDYKLSEGETMTLITKAENYEGEEEVETTKGVKKYLYSVGLEGDALMLGCIDTAAADQTKSFNEARLGVSAALNSASDLIASSVIDSANTVTDKWETFVTLGGSHSRYETGSHVDLNMFNVAAGLSKVVFDNLTLGIFAEGGNGRYNTENNFAEGLVTASGDINYFGGGLFAKVEGKKTELGQLHAEASFRAGYINSKYSSDNFEPGTNTSFNMGSPYLGAHAGFGYKWALGKDSKSNIDTYIKYLWNRQNSDSVTVDSENFDFDAINSHRLRVGFRYNGKEDKNGFNFFGGLAYEYEFDGKAKGHMGEYALLEPDFKGGSGMAELGFRYHNATSPWKVELALQGFTGKRDSIGANLSVWYMFGK